MLELRNISYEVKDAQENREILKDINLSVDNHFVAAKRRRQIDVGEDNCRNTDPDFRPDTFRRKGHYAAWHYGTRKGGNQLCVSTASAF